MSSDRRSDLRIPSLPPVPKPSDEKLEASPTLAPEVLASGTNPNALYNAIDAAYHLRELEEKLDRCIAGMTMHFQPIVHATEFLGVRHGQKGNLPDAQVGPEILHDLDAGRQDLAHTRLHVGSRQRDAAKDIAAVADVKAQPVCGDPRGRGQAAVGVARRVGYYSRIACPGGCRPGVEQRRERRRERQPQSVQGQVEAGDAECYQQEALHARSG